MAITALNTLRQWFSSGKKPTQSQFWAWLDSFWHKGEKIPISSIEGFNSVSEAPEDGKKYVRKDGQWAEETANPTKVSELENDSAYLVEDDTKVSLTVTKAEGGYSVGDQIEAKTTKEVLANILAPYVAPSLSSISVTPGTTVEVGTTITLDSVSLMWDKDSEGNQPRNPAISNVGFDNIDLGNDYSIQIPAAANTTKQRTTAGSEEWRFTAEDKEGNALPYKYDRIYWYYRRFFGASALEVIDDASAKTLIEALQQSWLDANRAGTATCTADNANASNYTYIVHAASLGDLSGIIMNGATPVLGAFTKVGNFNYTNAANQVVSYAIYKSNAKGAFSSGDSLVIS